MTLRQCDPSFSDQLDKAWRGILEVGIKYMTSKY